jgi:hypothetical protein
MSETTSEILQEVMNGHGVGSQLWRILQSLGVDHNSSCSCLLLADVMNELGPKGCVREREKLLDLMRKNQKKYGWYHHFKAGVNAILLGWAFQLNPLDPLPGLLDRAISLAEEQLCQSGPMAS